MDIDYRHRLSHGVYWAHVHRPKAENKLFGPNVQGKVVSAPPGRECPRGKARVQFVRKLGRCGRRERLFRQFYRVLRERTKQGRQLFRGKSSPQAKS